MSLTSNMQGKYVPDWIIRYPENYYEPVRPVRNGQKIRTKFPCQICQKEVEFDYTVGSTVIVTCANRCREIWRKINMEENNVDNK